MMDEEWDMNKKAAEAWGFLGWVCRWGCVGAFLFPFLLIFLAAIIFMIEPEVSEKILWHGKEFYLQYESYMGGNGGYHLLYQLNDEKVEVLPHVYGYEKGKDYIYLAAAEGYGVIDRRTGIAKIVRLSAKIPYLETEKIQYDDSLQLLDKEEWAKVTSLQHTLRAYYVSIPWRDSDTKTVGDGRFRYVYGWVGEHRTYQLEGYGVYGNYEDSDVLLSELNGFVADESTQMMYVTSPQGYAIVDGLAGTCRVYFTDQELAEKEYQKDIYVLDSFDDFTPEEQEMLRQVEKDGLP